MAIWVWMDEMLFRRHAERLGFTDAQIRDGWAKLTSDPNIEKARIRLHFELGSPCEGTSWKSRADSAWADSATMSSFATTLSVCFNIQAQRAMASETRSNATPRGLRRNAHRDLTERHDLRLVS